MTVTVYLRNVHAKRTVMVPIRPGWCRMLKPAVTARVPAAVLHTSAVRRLLSLRMVDVIDVTAWNAEARQRQANRTDWARAIAEAEQREFDGLLGRAPRGAGSRRPKERKRRADEWPSEWTARLRQRWAEGATGTTIAVELGVSLGAVRSKALRLGLPGRDWSRSG